MTVLSMKLKERTEKEHWAEEVIGIKNEYYSKFMKVFDHLDFSKPDILGNATPKEEYDSRNGFDKYMKRTLIGAKFREEAVQKWAWAVPTTEAIIKIARFSPIISIGAGSGYWEMLLSSAGAEVVAFDKMWKAKQQFKFHELYYSVIQGDEREILRYPNHTLFLCWPSYQAPFAANALKITKAKYVVYVGEWYAATATEDFHDDLEERFEQLAVIKIPSYPHIRDRVWIYRRKSIIDLKVAVN